MKLGIDLDGCLADFNTAYGNLTVDTTKVDLFPDGWRDNLNVTYPTSWNWELDAGYTKEQMRMVWDRIVKSPDFWASLGTLPGAVETLKVLNKLSKSGYDIYFLTNRMGGTAKRQSEAWLQQHGYDLPTVLLCGDKYPVIHALGIKFFVDDRLDAVNNIFRASAADKYDLDLYLIDAPYNLEHREKGLKSAPSVADALKASGLWLEQLRGRPRKTA